MKLTTVTKLIMGTAFGAALMIGIMGAVIVGSNPTASSAEATSSAQATTHFCEGRVATIVGSNGPDVINGFSGSDVIVGLGGDDTLKGNGGDDFICGGNGDDVLRGNDGNDTLQGGNGHDGCNGGLGRDNRINCEYKPL